MTNVHGKECVLILDNLRSVENTGSIFRTAECFGVKKIVLVGTTPAPTDRFGRKRPDLSKVSLGAEELVQWEQEKNIESAISKLKSEGFQIVSLEQHANSIPLKTFKPQDRLAIIVGNEVEGVSKTALDNSDAIVEIPMKGRKESLNVAVATGVAIFKLLE